MKQLLLFLTFTTALFSQEWRTDIKLLGGVSAANLDTDHLATAERIVGGGYMAGVEGAVNLNSVFAFTGHYAYNDLSSGVRLFCNAPSCERIRGTAGFQEYMGGIRIRGNSDGRVSPYIGISAGGARLATEANVNLPGTSIPLKDSASKFAFAPGMGFDVKIVKHFAIGLDARYVKAINLASFVRVGLGLSVRF